MLYIQIARCTSVYRNGARPPVHFHTLGGKISNTVYVMLLVLVVGYTGAQNDTSTVVEVRKVIGVGFYGATKQVCH